jgi:PRC-barrel domain
MKKMITLTASMFAIAAASPAFAQDAKAPSVAPAEKQIERMDSTQGTDPLLKGQPQATRRSSDSAANAANKDTAYKSVFARSDWRASNLIGSSIRNAANEPIGDINDLLIGANGEVSAVVVGVGGFLGIGEKNVALPFNELSFSKNENGNTVVMSKATKQTLESMPEWKNEQKL